MVDIDNKIPYTSYIINNSEYNMNQLFNELPALISCPIDGPFEGEDYLIDNENNTIQVTHNNIKLAATIMRKVNTSDLFEIKLVKVGQAGDSILLGADTLTEDKAVYTANIGFQRDTLAEVKKDKAGKLCLYLNKKRSPRMFNKMSSLKEFLKTLDIDLQTQGNSFATFDASIPESEIN